jgi:hypothetical protein
MASGGGTEAAGASACMVGEATLRRDLPRTRQAPETGDASGMSEAFEAAKRAWSIDGSSGRPQYGHCDVFD